MRDRVLVLQAPEWDEAGELKTWSAGLLATPAAPGQRAAESAHPDTRGRDAALAHPQRHRERLLRPAAGRAPAAPDRRRRQSVRTRPGARHAAHPAGRPRRGPRGGRLARQLRAAGAALRSRRRLRRRPSSCSRRSIPRPAGGRGDRCGHAACWSRSATSGALPVANRRTITFTMRGGFLIDGKRFDPERVDQFVALDTVEEWTVVNDSPLVHPFHIHVNPFQLTHVNGSPWTSPATGTPSPSPRSAAGSRSAPCSRTSRAGPCSTATSSPTPISG